MICLLYLLFSLSFVSIFLLDQGKSSLPIRSNVVLVQAFAFPTVSSVGAENSHRWSWFQYVMTADCKSDLLDVLTSSWCFLWEIAILEPLTGNFLSVFSYT